MFPDRCVSAVAGSKRFAMDCSATIDAFNSSDSPGGWAASNIASNPEKSTLHPRAAISSLIKVSNSRSEIDSTKRARVLAECSSWPSAISAGTRPPLAGGGASVSSSPVEAILCRNAWRVKLVVLGDECVRSRMIRYWEC